MSGYRVSLSLASVCLWLCRAALAISAPGQPQSSNVNNSIFLLQSSATCPAPVLANTAPCQPSHNYNSYNTFLHRHVVQGTPQNLIPNQWRHFLNNNGLIRPTQSFLNPSDQPLVDEVCSPLGGKVYRNNLCISIKEFTFIEVCSTITNGQIDMVTSVNPETKHLILGCDMLTGHCLPVHFDGNPYNVSPNPRARGCGP